MQCDNCGANLPEGVRTCVKCGRTTEISAFAANVGAPVAARGQVGVPAPRKSNWILPVLMVLLILAAAWVAFQWLSSN
jgi:hypothetical protein